MGTSRTISCVILAAGLSLVFVDSANAIKILYHGREAGPTFRDDPFAFAHLETVYGADNVDYLIGTSAAADGSSAIGYDVVFISSTMASSATRDKYEDSTVGMVFGEGALTSDNDLGNFMLSDSSGNQDATASTTGRTKINILEPSHPLAAGLSGEVTVFNTSPLDTYWWQFGRGVLGPGVERIAGALLDVPAASVSGDYSNNFEADAADYVLYRDNEGATLAQALPNNNGLGTTVTSAHYDLWRARFGNNSAANDANQHAILAADVGAALLGNGTTGSPATAAGRRVFFFMSDFGFADLTTDGVALFDASISWAGAPVAASGSALGAVPEPACCSLAVIALLGSLGIRRRRLATEE